jgi:ubiquinone biosynthesis protein UbiJ
MLTATIENLLNRGLPRSPRAQELCAEIAGKRVALNVTDIVRLLVESTGSTLRVTRGDTPADAELSGGPLSLWALGGRSQQAVLQRGDVRISGDAELAGKFQELAGLLRLDPEEELSLLVGDVPAHTLGRLIGGVLRFGRRAVFTGVKNIAEYLGHETQDLVPRAEGEQFLKGVDAVREDVDRLEARIKLLARHRPAR